MAGFRNEVLYCENVDFTGATIPTPQVTLNGQLLIGSTVAPNIRVATLTAGAGISITNGPGTITISNAGAGPSWNFINGSPAPSMLPDNGYVCNGGGAIVLLLPPVSTEGQEIEIYLDGSASWQITQGAGQRILYGNTLTTAGAGGSITSTAQGDSIRMLCVVANTRWVVLSGVGNPVIV